MSIADYVSTASKTIQISKIKNKNILPTEDYKLFISNEFCEQYKEDAIEIADVWNNTVVFDTSALANVAVLGLNVISEKNNLDLFAECSIFVYVDFLEYSQFLEFITERIFLPKVNMLYTPSESARMAIDNLDTEKLNSVFDKDYEKWDEELFIKFMYEEFADSNDIEGWLASNAKGVDHIKEMLKIFSKNKQVINKYLEKSWKLVDMNAKVNREEQKEKAQSSVDARNLAIQTFTEIIS